MVQTAGSFYGQQALNKFGEKGVKLPNVKGKIEISDTELIVENGALVIAAYLNIKFQQPPSTPNPLPTPGGPGQIP